MAKTKILLSCEHATNFVPEKYLACFPRNGAVKGRWGELSPLKVLETAWGLDLGALGVAKYLEQELRTKLHAFPVSRILIEGNRYRNSSLFSRFTQTLPEEEKSAIRDRYWLPHVQELERTIRANAREGRQTIQIAIHSFVPVWNGLERDCDIGILFDPTRPSEKRTAHLLQDYLREELPGFTIRRNYPYIGYSEGLTKYLRKQFADRDYQGFELETNNKHLSPLTEQGKLIRHALATAINKL